MGMKMAMPFGNIFMAKKGKENTQTELHCTHLLVNILLSPQKMPFVTK